MLDLPRYLLGVSELILLVGFATLGASAARARLLPSFAGAPAHLATAVLALALLIWTAELLGTLGLYEPLPYVASVAVVGLVVWGGAERGWGRPSRAAASRFSPVKRPRTAADPSGEKPSQREGRPHPLMTLAALAIAAIAAAKFGLETRPELSSGMTGFDSTWYHAPFAAGFIQSGDTWDLHFIAPQFLAWFYPANAELFHAAGMLSFGRDLLSPLLNLGWFAGCLLACWCIGRPYRVAPWSLALGAVALSVPALADQAGEARNDIVGIFFLLAAVGILLNARQQHANHTNDHSGRSSNRIAGRTTTSTAVVVGLAAGLAAGTKLNFLVPAVVLVFGLAVAAPSGRRWSAFLAGSLAALAGGGYWYLRNLAHAGNPLPWFDSLGPISLPAPDQALGGREGHSVLGYLADGAVWSDWFLPGLRDGLTVLWPLLLALALAGLVLCLGRRADAGQRLAGLVGLAALVAWLIAPTSASGPEGMARGFESGLRYLAPALVLGLALVPVVARARLRDAGPGRLPSGRILKVPRSLARHLSGRGAPWARVATLALLVAIAVGYPVQRHYLRDRYADPSFAVAGLNAAFAWATPLSDARIATTSTRQYPLYGTELSNRVEFVGERRPHGGFVPPTTCRRWRELLNEGEYDYVVATRDRLERGKPPYPAAARWTAAPAAQPILRKPPTVIFKLSGPLDPSTCK